MRWSHGDGDMSWSHMCAGYSSIVPIRLRSGWRGRQGLARRSAMRQSDETMFPASTDNVNLTSNWLVGVIDDPQQAEQAERELLEAGFPRDHVLLLHPDDAL